MARRRYGRWQPVEPDSTVDSMRLRFHRICAAAAHTDGNPSNHSSKAVSPASPASPAPAVRTDGSSVHSECLTDTGEAESKVDVHTSSVECSAEMRERHEASSPTSKAAKTCAHASGNDTLLDFRSNLSDSFMIIAANRDTAGSMSESVTMQPLAVSTVCPDTAGPLLSSPSADAAPTCPKTASTTRDSVDHKNAQTFDERSTHILSTETPDLEALLPLATRSFADLPPNPKKIAEASFSEVFLADGRVYKLAPIDEHYSRHAFAKESAILRLLQGTPGVCCLHTAFLVRGPYSPAWLAAWEAFPTPENASPATHPSDRLYGCLVMSPAGADLEATVFPNAAALLTFTYALVHAVAGLERRFRLEHRDLHWGNVMVSGTAPALIDFSLSRLEVTATDIARERERILATEHTGGDKATLIGAKNATPANAIYPRVLTIYTDLEPMEWLFTGDGRVDAQFDVYRRMRRLANGRWNEYHPQTNYYWFLYLIRKLMDKAAALPDATDRAQAVAKLTRIRQVLWVRRDVTALSAWLTEQKVS